MKSLRRIRNRHKRCFELAMKVMLEEPGAEKFTLVHGRTGFGPDDAWPAREHAWIELLDGRVYDVVLDRTFTMDEYVAWWGSIEIDDRYTQKQAATLMLETDHMGPWRDVMPERQ
jgi:hypothetical protein